MNDIVFDQFFSGNAFDHAGHQQSKTRTIGCSRPGKEKKGPGPDQQALPKGKGPSVKNAGHAAQGSLMETGKKGAGGGKHSHYTVHVVAQIVKERHLVHLTVLQNQGNELNGEHTEVEGKTKGHLGEHGVHIGMPENEPATQGLANVDGQDEQGGTIADKPDHHGQVDDVFQLIDAQDIFEQPGKKSAAANGDNSQVRPDPQGKSVIVVHIGLVQAFEPAQAHGVNAPQQNHTHHCNPRGKDGEGAAVCTFGY